VSLQTRLVGVSHEGPDEEHKALYDAYVERLAAISPTEFDLSGGANVYDAVYFLAYAAVAGGTGGANMNTGMNRLLGLTDDSRHDIGPESIDSVVDRLRSGQGLSLVGALGPPSFDPLGGGRYMFGSVWCINEDSEFVMDALRLEDMAQPNPAGLFPCFYL